MTLKAKGRTRLNRKPLIAIALGCLMSMSSAFAADPVSRQEVAAVLSAYAEALRIGDTYALGDLLGGELLANSAPLWETPEYRYDLAEANADTTIRIVSLLTHQNHGQAFVRISQKMGELEIQKDLIVARLGNSVRIVDERVASH